MSGENDFIRRDFMCKRSRNKNKMTRSNYKSRWFELTDSRLTYFDGDIIKGIGKEKGSVFLDRVCIVETVEPDALDNKEHAFQVVYCEGNHELIPLYIISNTKQQQEDWIKNIRSVCRKLNASFSEKYHPGVWHGRKFTCCEQISKDAPGCKPTFTQPDRKSEATAANVRKQLPLPQLPGGRPGNNAEVKKVVALFDYAPAEIDDLALTRGEEYFILDDTTESWWKAKNKKGEIGYIPANYIRMLGKLGLDSYEWYYRSISRSDAEQLLRSNGNEGCFLVRESTAQQGAHTLSVLTLQSPEGTVHHYHVKKDPRGLFYFADKHCFGTIPELIDYHKHNSAGLVVRLRNSPNPREPATAGFGHAKKEIRVAELELGATLGSGQFGIVRKGKYRGRIDVAVKIMKEGAMSENDFIDEAKTMMSLQHPHLVQFYGVVTEKSPIMIVTEFMCHGSLLTFLKRQKGRLLNMSNTLLNMSIQTCQAMVFLEKKNFIHRDLAARNCLVGENEIVKVGDFGLTRHVIDDDYIISSGAKFPIKWSPPEVLGYTRYSSKADVWSFGVLMWEIFTCGKMPYGAMKNAEVVELVVHRNKRLEKPDNCPEDVYEVMLNCWAAERDERPTFVELYNHLEELGSSGYHDKKY